MGTERSSILERISSKKTSIEEFNYDTLTAPPIWWFLSPYDIQELYNNATSISLSAKPEVRYDKIHEIMTRRGLIKFAAGTNRVVYRHPNYPDILFKIAADDVGMHDNPAEYKNQFLIKPFCAKTFEVDPTGTVAIVERCQQLRNREEYISIADDVFELINTWLIGEYVLADFGSKFFMNVAIRKGFGVVLIDYPYIYKLDGNKLYCNKPDLSSPSGKCDGVIDYDDGYNFLRCTKCGATYKAKELGIKIDSNEVIIKRKGDIKMEVKISGGSQSIQEHVVSSMEQFDAVPTQPTSLKLKAREVAIEHPEPKKEEPKLKKKEAPVEKKPVVEKTVNGVNNQNLRNPVQFSEETKKEALENKKDTDKSPVKCIEDALNVIVENLKWIDIDAVKERTRQTIKEKLGFADTEKLSLEKALAVTKEMLDDLNEEEKFAIANNPDLIGIAATFDPEISIRDYHVDTENNRIQLEANVDMTVYDPDTQEFISKYNYDLSTEYDYAIDDFGISNETSAEGEAVQNGDEAPSDDDNRFYYKGVEFFDAYVMNIRDIFPTQQPAQVLVFKSGDEYAVNKDNGYIIASDTINDTSLENNEVVSKEWLENVLAENKEYEQKANNVKQLPTGVLAPVNEDVIEEASTEEGDNQEKIDQFLEEEDAQEE